MLLLSRYNNILIFFFFFFFFMFSFSVPSGFAALPDQHPRPELVVQHLQSSINASVTRRRHLLSTECLTGNPIDDCWRCDPNSDRQHLADCAVGFGRLANGGKGGSFYTVRSSSDDDPLNPSPGTLRHAVIQTEPLWIIFETSMVIKLKHELVFNSFKTIDGRGADVHVTGYGCIILQHVTHVIIHNVNIHGCRPSRSSAVRSSPSHVEKRGGSDGDGISILGSSQIWIDHCSLSDCADGLIDVTLGSTAVTISNNYFSHHDKVMLLGHSDSYSPDSGMQVTIGFNRFGEGLVQRMPRCRWGYVHVVNNDFTEWQMYAIGGSASPTINSQGNRYTAPLDPNAKEVTRRLETTEGEWEGWNWRTDGDVLVNGAFFVPSGDGISPQYAKASSMDPKSGELVDQLTINAGVLGISRENAGGNSRGGATGTPGFRPGNGGGGYGDGDLFGMIFGGHAVSNHSSSSFLLFLAISILFLQTIV